MINSFAVGDAIVLGTQNPGKIAELTDLFSHYGLRVLSLNDFSKNSIPEPEETGLTFLDNALIKAKYYAKHLNHPVLSDDSGLCIAALDDKPGVHTKRFFEELGGYDQGFAYLEQMLASEDHPKPYKASMHCVLGIAWPEGTYKEFEGICDGHLVFPARSSASSKGFGVDPIFVPKGHDKTFAEDVVYKQNVSHRARAIQAMLKGLFPEILS